MTARDRDNEDGPFIGLWQRLFDGKFILGPLALVVSLLGGIFAFLSMNHAILSYYIFFVAPACLLGALVTLLVLWCGNWDPNSGGWEATISLFTTIGFGLLLYPMMIIRDTPRKPSCLSNQKQIATALQMFTQDNEERFFTLSANEAWPVKISSYVESKVYDCPTTRTKGSDSSPEFGFNATLSGIKLGQITSHASCPVTADLQVQGHAPDFAIRRWTRDVDPRHDGGAIMGFVDGHVQYISFSCTRGRILRTLYDRGFDPYDGAGATLGEREELVEPPSGTTHYPLGILPPVVRGITLSGEFQLDDISRPGTIGFTLGSPTMHTVGFDVTARSLLLDTHRRALTKSARLVAGTWYRLSITGVDGHLYTRLTGPSGNLLTINTPGTLPPAAPVQTFVTADTANITLRHLRCNAW